MLAIQQWQWHRQIFILADISFQINLKLLKFSSIHDSELKFQETFNRIEKIDFLGCFTEAQLLQLSISNGKFLKEQGYESLWN